MANNFSMPITYIQTLLTLDHGFKGPVDGVLDQTTRKFLEKAITAHESRIKEPWLKWTWTRKIRAYEQIIMHSMGFYNGDIDGLYGPLTLYALEKWQNCIVQMAGKFPTVEDSISRNAKAWPRQRDVPTFFGKVGTNQVLIKPPYTLHLYDTKKIVEKISLHKEVVNSATRVLTRVKDYYGAEKIDELHLNRFFGSLNIRPMKGGTSYSMHSWGIAIDFDANRNQLRWGRDKAAFAKPAYNKWWEFWEEEGWVSLGRTRNFDWMHVQAARL